MAKRTKIFYLLLFGTILLALSYQFSQVWALRDSSITFSKGEPIAILPGESITQHFLAQSGSLKQIEFLVRNPEPKEGDRITVILADADCQTALEETILERSYYQSDNVFVARFDKPQKTSPNEPYCIKLFFDPKQAESKMLRFFTLESKPDTLVELRHQNIAKKDQSLAMKPAYTEPSLIKNLETLTDRVSQYKPWFLKEGYLVVVVAVFLITTTLGTILIILLP